MTATTLLAGIVLRWTNSDKQVKDPPAQINSARAETLTSETARERSTYGRPRPGRKRLHPVAHLPLITATSSPAPSDHRTRRFLVIVEAALRLGDRVAGLVWLSSFRSLDSFPNGAETEAWFAPFRSDPLAAVEDLNRRNFGPEADPSLVDAVVTKARALDPERTLGLLTSMFRHDPTVADALDHLNAPVFAVNPDFKPTDEASFSRHGVELRLIPRVGHFLMMEAPYELNNELQRLLSGSIRTRP